MGSPSCCFPSLEQTHDSLQTVLLAREMASMMRWDNNSKSDVNFHFGKVNETRHDLGYLGNLSIDDVLKSVLIP